MCWGEVNTGHWKDSGGTGRRGHEGLTHKIPQVENEGLINSTPRRKLGVNIHVPLLVGCLCLSPMLRKLMGCLL